MSNYVWSKNTSLKVADGEKMLACKKGAKVPEGVLNGWGEKGVESAVVNKLIADVSDEVEKEKLEQLRAQSTLKAAKEAKAAANKKGGKK